VLILHHILGERVCMCVYACVCVCMCERQSCGVSSVLSSWWACVYLCAFMRESAVM